MIRSWWSASGNGKLSNAVWPLSCSRSFISGESSTAIFCSLLWSTFFSASNTCTVTLPAPIPALPLVGTYDRRDECPTPEVSVLDAPPSVFHPSGADGSSDWSLEDLPHPSSKVKKITNAIARAALVINPLLLIFSWKDRQQ